MSPPARAHPEAPPRPAAPPGVAPAFIGAAAIRDGHLGPDPVRDEGPDGTRPAPARADIDALLRDHVVAALVGRGVIPPGPVDLGRPRHPPTRGATRVTSTPARVEREHDAPADVHVHIDRVQVLPAGPRPAPAPARSALAPVDHAAYLARRRRGDR